MEKSLHVVSNLSADARSLVEALVGHPLPDHQAFYIITLDVAGEPLKEQREEAWQQLEAMMAEMRRSAAASGLSDDDIDQIIDETCEEVRYGRKP
jgi:hypothetical protein